jgi:SAM-dependent methyltransferase
MISTPQQFSMLIEELGGSAWTLAAIGTLFESGLADALKEPRTPSELEARCSSLSRTRIERVLAVAVLRGVVGVEDGRYQLAPGVLPSLEPGPRAVLRGDYRSYLLQPAHYLRDAIAGVPASGWRHEDPLVLQAQGDGSSMFASVLREKLIHGLGDLAARFERPGATFLDVGVGVGALSIAMCQCFPHVRAVGLDTSSAPLGLARQNVERASLGERVELRQTRVQDLRDETAFDLAWIPTFFLGDRQAVADAFARVGAALRPGGFVLTPTVNPSAGEAERTLWSLVMEAWGGPVLDAREAEALLKQAGLVPRALPGPSWVCMVVAQRPAS